MLNNLGNLMGHNIEIRFEPSVGKTYYLYERFDGSTFLSILSPEEWSGDRFYKKFVVSVLLNSEGQWQRTPC